MSMGKCKLVRTVLRVPNRSKRVNAIRLFRPLPNYDIMHRPLPDIMSSEFIGLVDALRVPVGPKERILEDGNGERMRQSAFHHSPPSGSVQPDAFNDVVLRVGPVNVVDRVIDGESIGPNEILSHQDLSVGAVHVGALDPWLMAPICPNDSRRSGVDGNGPRLLDVLPDERPPHRPVQ